MEENKQVLFFCDMPSKLMMAVFVLLLKVLQESPNFTSQSKPQQYKTIEKKVIFYLVLILMNRIPICGIETRQCYNILLFHAKAEFYWKKIMKLFGMCMINVRQLKVPVLKRNLLNLHQSS